MLKASHVFSESEGIEGKARDRFEDWFLLVFTSLFFGSLEFVLLLQCLVGTCRCLVA